MPTPKQARRERGSGTIFFHPQRRLWIARVPVGGHTKGGYTRYREVSDPSQRVVVDRMSELTPPGPDTTVRQWAAKWLKFGQVRDSTRDGYADVVRLHIVPLLGNFRVSALTTIKCDEAVQEWGKALAAGTVRSYLAVLRNCLNAARKAGLCRTNPAADVKMPKPPKKLQPHGDPADLPALVSAALKHPRTYCVGLLASVGLRIGELVALDVTDYDAATGELSISKTWTRAHGTRGAKSDQSYRIVRIPEPVKGAIDRVRGKRIAGPLFTTWDGVSRLYTEAVRSRVRETCSRAGVPYRTPHQIRHAVATALHGLGIPIPDAAAYLGHTEAVYVKTYIHRVGIDPSAKLAGMLRQTGKVGQRA